MLPCKRTHQLHITSSPSAPGSFHPTPVSLQRQLLSWASSQQARPVDLKRLFLQNRHTTMPKAAAKKKAPAKEKKEKKEKDPNAPKRPLTAYFLYANDMRPKVKADNPSFKVTEVASHIGAMWKEASDKDKEKYQKKAGEEKKKYEAAVAKYKAKQ